MQESLKIVRVVAAVIRSTNERAEAVVLATQRGYGEQRGGWEFPGGKIELGETPQMALVREIQEELDMKIEVGELIHTIEYDYPKFHLSMDCFWCRLSPYLSKNAGLVDIQDGIGDGDVLASSRRDSAKPITLEMNSSNPNENHTGGEAPAALTLIANNGMSNFFLKEHEDAKWLTKQTLRSVEWLPADITLIDEIEKFL